MAARIMNGLKIMGMRMEHMTFLDSVSFLTCALRKLPEAFGLRASKSWYLHYFNMKENLDYVGPIPDVSYYGVNDERFREESFSTGKKVIRPRSFITSACQNPTTKVTSRFYGNHAKSSGASLFRSGTLRHSWNQLQLLQHAIKCCANGS